MMLALIPDNLFFLIFNLYTKVFFSPDELLSGKSGGECRMKKDEVAAADLRS